MSSGEVLGPGDLEGDPVVDAGLVGAAAGGGDRRVVVVEADDRAVRVGLPEQDGGGAVAAADVGDADAALESFDHTVEGGQPRGTRLAW